MTAGRNAIAVAAACTVCCVVPVLAAAGIAIAPVGAAIAGVAAVGAGLATRRDRRTRGQETGDRARAAASDRPHSA